MSLTAETETISFNSGDIDCSGSLVSLKRTAGIVRNSPSHGLRLSPANTSTLALLRRLRPPIT